MSKTVVFSWGRMQPPTKGHQKLVDAVKLEAGKRKAEPHIYLSQTHDRTKNPLKYQDKIKYAQAAFGPTVKRSGAKTIIELLKILEKKSVTDIVMVVGSDRIQEFRKILTNYNGREFNFNSIDVISSGERDPDENNSVEGISATKVREAAKNDDFDTFQNMTPTSLSSAQVKKLYRDLGGKKTVRGENIGLANVPSGKQWWKLIFDTKTKKNQTRLVMTKASGDKLDAFGVLRKEVPDADNMRVDKHGIKEEINYTPQGKKIVKESLADSITDEELEFFIDVYEDEIFEDDDYFDFNEAVDIKKEYDLYKEKDSNTLRDILSRSRKVADLRGVPKSSLISMILRDKYGNKKVAAAFNLKEEELIEAPMTIQQRLKRRRIMKRLAPKMKRRREMMKKKLASNEKLKLRSRKAAIKLLRQRFAGKQGANYATLSPSQKMGVDRIIQKKMGSIAKISARLMPKIRKAEQERVKQARSVQREQKESLFNKFLEIRRTT